MCKYLENTLKNNGLIHINLSTIFLLIITVFIFSSCSSVNPVTDLSTESTDTGVSTTEEIVTSGENAVSPLPEVSEKDRLINRLLNSMTLEEKIGQMFIHQMSSITEINDTTAALLERHKLGGVVYFAENIDTVEQTIRLSEDVRKISGVPPFIAIDEEGGRVTRITKSEKMNIKNTPSARIIGNTDNSENAYTVYKIIAHELKALGINTCFAPVGDLSDKYDGAIGDRAFGAEPFKVGEFAVNAVNAFNDNKVVSTVKHFPGHGTVEGDTHDEKIVSLKSFEEMEQTDIIPFKMTAEAGVPMIMLSHITAAGWDTPASLSKEAVGYIRLNMNYEGIIITDSFCMGAITNYYTTEDAVKKAVMAGVDIVLMPYDIESAFSCLVSAVENGEIEAERINDSVYRILSVKYDYGLFEYNGNIDKYRRLLDEYSKRYYENNEPYF